MTAFDWASTTLGPIDRWSASLTTAVGLVLGNRVPMLIWWGEDDVCIYNDAYRSRLGDRHPAALGARASEIWTEAWGLLGPLAKAVRDGGGSTYLEHQRVDVARAGVTAETYWSFGFSPIPDERGISGVLVTVEETTAQVHARRQQYTLRELTKATAGSRDLKDACARASAVLAKCVDLSCSLICLVENTGIRIATRTGEGDLPPLGVASVDDPMVRRYRMLDVLRMRRAVVTEHGAVSFPLLRWGNAQPLGVLILGVSPQRPLDTPYRGFLDLIAAEIGRSIANALVYDEERRQHRQLSPVAPLGGDADLGAIARSRILIADDDPDTRETLRAMLDPYFEIDVASNGMAALAALSARPYDLLLTDVMMPELDGFGLLRQMRGDSQLSNIPVIVLSVRGGEDERVEGLDSGADDYLVKPCSKRELIARVTMQLRLRQARHERAQLLRREQAARQDAELQKERLQAANSAKDEFLAMLGHELRNPLTPIATTLQVMRLRGSCAPELELMERQLSHMTRLVDDLLDISRITRGKIELRRRPIEMASLVTNAIEMASPLFEQREHRLVVDVAARGLGVEVDPDRMIQVLFNLLTNAAKYSHPGSRIDVSAARVGDRIRIAVRDQGIGIPAELQPRVFDMFVQHAQTLDRSTGGLGLGLAIVRSLVEMHGGSVAVSSEGLDRGTELIVTLPAVEVGAEHEILLAREQAMMSPGTRILVVDDNPDVVLALRIALNALGHIVETAHDGPSALRTAECFKPEVALLDLGLPAMDGYELARRLRDQRQGIHLVAVTGYGQDSDRKRTHEAGFECHLVKPVDVFKLDRVVRDLAVQA